MPELEKKQYFDREYSSNAATDPSTGDFLVLTADNDFILTELIFTAENAGTVQVIRRDSGGGNAETLAEPYTTEFNEGDFEDPVAEAGPDKEIAIVLPSSITGEVTVTVRKHDRRF